LKIKLRIKIKRAKSLARQIYYNYKKKNYLDPLDELVVDEDLLVLRDEAAFPVLPDERLTELELLTLLCVEGALCLDDAVLLLREVCTCEERLGCIVVVFDLAPLLSLLFTDLLLVRCVAAGVLCLVNIASLFLEEVLLPDLAR